MLNSSQAKVASYRYDPFGNIISSSGTLASANVYRFSSKEIHTASGMYYYGYRFYDPNLQRWLNRDPIGESGNGGFNLYNFCLNDTCTFVDPYGLAVIQNKTDVPILVGGGAGPGEGHNPGNEVYVVVPPGGTIGGSNPMAGYPTPEDAVKAYKNPGSVPSTGTLYDPDYWFPPTGGESLRVYGDDQRPHYIITKGRNRTGGDIFTAAAKVEDWPGAFKDWCKRK